jgi:predicted Zn-dependent protease
MMSLVVARSLAVPAVIAALAVGLLGLGAAQAAESSSADLLQPAVGQFEAGNGSEAEKLLRDLVKSRPDDPEAAYYLGRIHFNRREPDPAIESVSPDLPGTTAILGPTPGSLAPSRRTTIAGPARRGSSR